VPACAVVTVRVCDCVPPPHVTVHALHAAHADTTQSTGHVVCPHACVVMRDGQLPPDITIVRVADCVPPPHVTLQAAMKSESAVRQFKPTKITHMTKYSRPTLCTRTRRDCTSVTELERDTPVRRCLAPQSLHASASVCRRRTADRKSTY
jgi:hypothetical protein